MPRVPAEVREPRIRRIPRLGRRRKVRWVRRQNRRQWIGRRRIRPHRTLRPCARNARQNTQNAQQPHAAPAARVYTHSAKNVICLVVIY